MKATVATMLGLLAVGSLVAATVEGNNTAVVIQKDIVESANGYQLLCVPVDGLDITGGTGTTIAVADMFPTATYGVGSAIYETTSTGAIGSTPLYVMTATGWSWQSTTTTDPGLSGGQVLWVSTANASSEEESGTQTTAVSSSTATVFCGGQRDGDAISIAQGLNLLKNDSSSSITVNSLVASPTANDQILRLQSGSNNYARYIYISGVSGYENGWYLKGVKVTDTDVIEPGEAFYYNAKAAQTSTQE